MKALAFINIIGLSLEIWGAWNLAYSEHGFRPLELAKARHNKGVNLLVTGFSIHLLSNVAYLLVG